VCAVEIVGEPFAEAEGEGDGEGSFEEEALDDGDGAVATGEGVATR